MQVELIKVNVILSSIQWTEKHQIFNFILNNDRVFCPLLVTESAILLKLYHIHLTKIIIKLCVPCGSDFFKTKLFIILQNMC